MSFFEQVLAELNLHPDEVEDIYFTGAITSPPINWAKLGISLPEARIA